MRSERDSRFPHDLPASFRGAVSIPPLAFLLLLLLPIDPARADIAPESGLLVHVQPVSGSCETPITRCSEITRSTTQDGPVEFLLFFMRGSIESYEPVCLESLHDEISWPDAWELLEFEQCGAGYGHAASVRSSGPLDLYWGGSLRVGAPREEVVLLARLVMNVVGPGELGCTGSYSESEVVLWHTSPQGNCVSPRFVTRPVKVPAEAGMQCGYISAHCGYRESVCEPQFWVDDLRLSAPLGGAADTSVRFWAPAHIPIFLCPVTIDTHAPWCTAWAESVDYELAYLHVTADAADLQLGTYETAIEVVATGAGVARCLPVELTVDRPTATSAASWGRIKSLYR